MKTQITKEKPQQELSNLSGAFCFWGNFKKKAQVYYCQLMRLPTPEDFAAAKSEIKKIDELNEKIGEQVNAAEKSQRM